MSESDDARPFPKGAPRDPSRVANRRADRLDTGVRLAGDLRGAPHRTHRDAAEEAKKITEQERRRQEEIEDPLLEAERQLAQEEDDENEAGSENP